MFDFKGANYEKSAADLPDCDLLLLERGRTQYYVDRMGECVMETALGIVAMIALAMAIYMIGHLAGENLILKQQSNLGTNKNQRGEMARMEDALAVIADIRVRTALENERKEAVDHYVTERMNQLANYLSNARGYDPDAPVKRPKDY